MIKILKNYIISICLIIILVCINWVGVKIKIIDGLPSEFYFYILFFYLGTLLTAWEFNKLTAVVYSTLYPVCLLLAFILDFASSILYWVISTPIILLIYSFIISIIPYLITVWISKFFVKNNYISFANILKNSVIVLISFVLSYVILYMFAIFLHNELFISGIYN